MKSIVSVAIATIIIVFDNINLNIMIARTHIRNARVISYIIQVDANEMTWQSNSYKYLLIKY